MAKRFSDTNKWDKCWYRKLSPKMKCAWEYLTMRCDHAGIWDVDIETMSHFIGEVISLDEIINSFSSKVRLVDKKTKLFIPSFVEFQYGHLNEANRVHASVISRLEKIGINKDLISPLQGAQDKDTDTDTDTDKEGGVGEIQSSPTPADASDPKYKLDSANLEQAYNAWLDALKILKAGRSNLIAAEQTHIARAIQRHGVKAVVMALSGVPHAKGSPDFDASWFLDVSRVLNPKNFMRFMNLGVQAFHKQQESA